MAFPTTSVLDDFNTGANQLLRARTGWGSTAIVTGDPDMTTDAVPTYAVTSAAAYCDAWYNATSTNTEVWATMGTVVTDLYLYTRLTNVSPSSPNGYELECLAAGSVNLKKMTAHVSTQIATGTQVRSAGDAIGFSSIGTQHTVYYKAAAGSWSQMFTISDSTWTGAGVIGMLVQSGGRIDSFAGGAVVTAGSGAGSLGLLGVGV